MSFFLVNIFLFFEMNWNSICQLEIVNETEKAISENIKTVYDEQAPVVCKMVIIKKLHE